ncbi:hypothetical protein [Rhodococcus koreensis]|uniref:hypothetical protein n=1 Tax=Rhodococcus koreensis TaxID=99653 RepID=UPI00197F6945|nr:hypothetical protein [Rhodococcus koreensis]QSE86734.1 hypothetical protein JWS14_47625 [Rhodococcus koreensis]
MHHGDIDWQFSDKYNCWDEWYPPELGIGYLYVIEFDSGWIKAGHTTDWSRRLTQIRCDYRPFGWAFARPPWRSCVVSNEPRPGGERTDLRRIEGVLLDEARRTSDGHRFNPVIPGVGRDRSKPAATELFSGCSFGYLTAYAEVLARTDALV